MAGKSPKYEYGDRQDKVMGAVLECINLYGFKRTTMNDIAKRAGITRTALYHYYRNKEDIFVALSEMFHKRMLDAARHVLNGELEGEAFLYALLDTRMGYLYATIYSSGKGREMAEEYSGLVEEVSRKARLEYARLVTSGIERLQESNQINLEKVDTTAKAAANFVIACAEGLMEDHTVNSLPAYHKKLSLLVKTVYTGWQ